MFIRQSEDPDSMPSRRKRRQMFRKKQQEGEKTQEELYRDRMVLYHIDDLRGHLFLTQEDQEKALASGEWIDHPKMKLDEWLEFRKQKEEDAEIDEEEHINWAERLKFRDSNKPVVPSMYKKYVSQMNVAELIAEGKKYGLMFGTPETCPTKIQMKRKIKIAQRKAELAGNK